MRSNEANCYRSSVPETFSPQTSPSVCALPGCEVTVIQPARGGRHRLYCSNAHRAEARRRRLAGAPEPAPADAMGSALDRLAEVSEELRRQHETLRSIDPTQQALQTARVRAEATAEVLAAQQAATAAAEDAARARAQLVAERAAGEERLRELEGELDEMRAAATAATQNASAVHDDLAAAQAFHARELHEREQRAARTATAHEEHVAGLLDQLQAARTAASSAEARAQAAERRAGQAEDKARAAALDTSRAEAEANRLRAELAGARAALEAATSRAETAEGLAEEARSELAIERQRQDAAVAGLREQLAAIAAATAPRPRRTRSTTTPASAAAASGRPKGSQPEAKEAGGPRTR